MLTLPSVTMTPGDTIDFSWAAALHIAARHRLHYGSGFVFTYGPLGFLSVPIPYFSPTWALAVAYVGTLQIALCAALVARLRPSLGLAPAAGLAFLVAMASRFLAPTELALALFVFTCVLIIDRLERLDRLTPVRACRAVLLGGGAIAGAHVLVKFNTGIWMLLIGSVTAWLVRPGRWRSEAVFWTAAASALLAGWTITGNRLSELGMFLRRSAQIASGYSEAMGIEERARRWEYLLLGAVVVLLVAHAWIAIKELPRQRMLAIAAVLAVWLFAAVKHGFVRHDAHSVVFFGEAVVVAAALLPSAARRTETLVAVGLLLVALVAVSRSNPPGLVDPKPTPGVALVRLVDVLRPHRLADKTDAARERLREEYGLEEATLAALDGHTVHIHPLEASVAWAYPEIDWDPLPIFQGYTAYTKVLDEANASALAGDRGPERILAAWGTIDHRYADWDPPGAMLAMACRYVEIGIDGRWQILARAPNRCGPEEPVATLDAATGRAVNLPAPGPGRMLVARIHGLDSSLLYRLRAQLFKIPPITIVVDGTTSYRLVPGTAADGLVLSAPPTPIGWSPPFAFPATASTFEIRGGGWGVGTKLRIELTSIPLPG